ncbi:MAG: hypothetical protein ISS63_06480 [Desulfobacteraceae bacterium]|nr:hypothetical protein [Desulfobacteraceae bacterium]
MPEVSREQGAGIISAVLKDERRTSNVQVSEDSDIECLMRKDEETEFKKPELLD